MSSITSILAPVDFSPHSDHSVELASRLASRTGATLHLLHALGLPPPPTTPFPVKLPAALWTEVRDEARSRLEAMQRRVGSSVKRCEILLQDGPPATVICEAVEQTAASLVVMGSRGLSGLRHVLHGSVSERVLRHAHCPVVTAKEKDRLPEGGSLRRILVPIDFSETSTRALGLARSLSDQLGPAHVTLVHASYLPLEIESLGVHGVQKLVDESSEQARQELEATLVSLREAGISADAVVRRGPPDEVVTTLAREIDADMIVMGTHGHSGLTGLLLGSVATRVLRTAPCPTLTIGPESA